MASNRVRPATDPSGAAVTEKPSNGATILCSAGCQCAPRALAQYKSPLAEGSPPCCPGGILPSEPAPTATMGW